MLSLQDKNKKDKNNKEEMEKRLTVGTTSASIAGRGSAKKLHTRKGTLTPWEKHCQKMNYPTQDRIK